jgi:hypothetical protein
MVLECPSRISLMLDLVVLTFDDILEQLMHSILLRLSL